MAPVENWTELQLGKNGLYSPSTSRIPSFALVFFNKEATVNVKPW